MARPDASIYHDLSPYELTSLSLKADENSLLAVGLFITVISGFLVMSYAIGSKLSKRQSWLVVPLFLFFASLALHGATIFARFAEYIRADNFLTPGNQDFSGLDFTDPLAIPTLMLIIGILVIAACLMFFRDVRKQANKEVATSKQDIGDKEEESAE